MLWPVVAPLIVHATGHGQTASANPCQASLALLMVWPFALSAARFLAQYLYCRLLHKLRVPCVGLGLLLGSLLLELLCGSLGNLLYLGPSFCSLRHGCWNLLVTLGNVLERSLSILPLCCRSCACHMGFHQGCPLLLFSVGQQMRIGQ